MADNTPIQELVRKLDALRADVGRWTAQIDELKAERAVAQAESAEILEAIAVLRAARAEG
jgi:hypothetical protein